MINHIFIKFRNAMQKIEINIIGKWIFYGILIGLVGGLGAWIFMLCLNFSQSVFTEGLFYNLVPQAAHLPGHFMPLIKAPGWWLVPSIPVIGGVISGLLVYFGAPEAEGHGTDAVIHSFHHNRGHIRVRVPIIKTLASAAIIGTGGSAGREGPIAQIGAGFGSLLGKLLKVSVKDRRLMVLAGAAAGISAIFQAPLGGAIFTTEVLYRNHELETEALIPSVIASLTAYSLYTRLVGQERLFNLPPLRFERAEELLAYTVLGLLCVLAGIVYIKLFYGMRDRFFKPLPIPAWSKPALGGLLLGLLVLALPQVWGGGYQFIQQAMEHKLAISLMFLLVAGKIFATSFTISSGGSGGVFGPSLFIGAMLGGATGMLLADILPPNFVPDPTAMVIVGMGGFFAGVAKVPIASLIMVSEMTGDYGLLVPMMLVSTIAVLFTRHFSLYEKQALSTIDSPAHRGDFIIDLLAGLSLRDTKVMESRPISIRAMTPLAEMLKLMSGRKQNSVPVVDQENLVTGMIYFDDLREVLFEGNLDLNLVIAADVAKTDFPFITPHENLHQAITMFSQYGMDELPVLENEHGELRGLLTKHDVIYTYNQKMEALKQAGTETAKRGGYL